MGLKTQLNSQKSIQYKATQIPNLALKGSNATLVHFKANRFYITEICSCYTLREKKGKPLFRYATNQSIYEYSPQNSEYWIRCFHSTDYKEEPFLEIKSYINNRSRFGKETLLQKQCLGR